MEKYLVSHNFLMIYAIIMVLVGIVGGYIIGAFCFRREIETTRMKLYVCYEKIKELQKKLDKENLKGDFYD